MIFESKKVEFSLKLLIKFTYIDSRIHIHNVLDWKRKIYINDLLTFTSKFYDSGYRQYAFPSISSGGIQSSLNGTLFLFASA